MYFRVKKFAGKSTLQSVGHHPRLHVNSTFIRTMLPVVRNECGSVPSPTATLILATLLLPCAEGAPEPSDFAALMVCANLSQRDRAESTVFWAQDGLRRRAQGDPRVAPPRANDREGLVVSPIPLSISFFMRLVTE
jgi:hypothetical protein